jgi:hypothetical protein
MSSNSFIWSGERLRSDALKQGLSPLRCIFPIPGPYLVSEGWEKEGERKKSKARKRIKVKIFNFMMTHLSLRLNIVGFHIPSF